MINLLEELNPAQSEAVTETLNAPSLVVAGAGSGKTKVLTHRAAYLIQQGVQPWHILTVTFTNKATSEMRERLIKLIGEDDAKNLWCGTFHSICIRILRKHGEAIGLSKNFTIIDADEQKTIVKQVVNQELGLSNDKQIIGRIIKRIGDMKNRLITPEAYHGIKHKHADGQVIAQAYEAYQQRLERRKYLDFDDIIMKTVKLLSQDETARNYYQDRFHYIMVDEYQDTNHAQYKLISLLAGDKNNLFVVGDDYQGIYGWRGADIQNILDFEADYPSAKVVKLEQNYRSTGVIVAAGNEVARNNKRRLDKYLFTKKPEGEPIRVFHARNDNAEAMFVAQEIKNLVQFKGYKYHDIAVLYRSNWQSRQFEDKFMVGTVPYQMIGGFSFYRRKEIMDIIAYLRVMSNHDDDIALTRILTITPGLGKTTIDKLFAQAQRQGTNLYSAVCNYEGNPTKKIAEALDNIAGIVQKLSLYYQAGKTITKNPVTDMIELTLTRTNYIERLQESAKQEDQDRIPNIEELINIANTYETTAEEPDLLGFLEQIALASDTDKSFDGNSVKMMTLHAAKGLEFKVVFIVGMEEELMPHKNCFGDANAMEEERRLCYVGITRAMQELYCTYADTRFVFSELLHREPSRFLKEIPDKLKLMV